MSKDKFDIFELTDQQLDKLLGSAFFEISDLLKTKNESGYTYIELDQQKMAMAQLYVDGLLKEVPPNSKRFYLTSEGRDFIIRGGYKRRFEREEKLRKIADEKAEYDLYNAKRIFKTYWFTFGIALIGLAISIFLLILKIKEPTTPTH